jgi:hypothetical protein
MMITSAVLIFLLFNAATYWWVKSFDSLAAAISLTWTTIINNWMILIIICDSIFFLLLIFVWLLGDARERGSTGFRRWGWLVAMIAFGSPALLIYLVLRPRQN